MKSETCLATDAYLTTVPEVARSIQAWSYTFMEIDHEIISMVIFLPFVETFKKGCCQLRALKGMCRKYWLTACSSLPREKSG